MHIRNLYEFCVLAETLNFTSAAKELHITQSALSKHISSLEEDVGVKLLIRDSHYTRLTDQGRRFIESAQVIWSIYETAKETFYKESRHEYRLLVGGVVDNPGGLTLMSRAIDDIKKIDERFSINFVPASTTSITEQIVNKSIDCALLFYCKEDFNEAANSELEFIKVCNLPFMATMLESHPLADREELTMQDLEGQTLLHLVGPRFTSGWNRISRIADKHGVNIKRKTVGAISAFDYVGVDLEELIFILPQIEIKHRELLNSSKRVIRIVDEDAYFPYTIVHRKDNSSLALKTFIKSLTSVIVKEIEQPGNASIQGRWLTGELS